MSPRLYLNGEVPRVVAMTRDNAVERPSLTLSGSNPLTSIMYLTVMSAQRSLKKYFSALILCPVVMIFSYIQENEPFGRFYDFHNF